MKNWRHVVWVICHQIMTYVSLLIEISHIWSKLVKNKQCTFRVWGPIDYFRYCWHGRAITPSTWMRNSLVLIPYPAVLWWSLRAKLRTRSSWALWSPVTNARPRRRFLNTLSASGPRRRRRWGCRKKNSTKRVECESSGAYIRRSIHDSVKRPERQSEEDRKILGRSTRIAEQRRRKETSNMCSPIHSTFTQHIHHPPFNVHITIFSLEELWWLFIVTFSSLCY